MTREMRFAAAAGVLDVRFRYSHCDSGGRPRAECHVVCNWCAIPSLVRVALGEIRDRHRRYRPRPGRVVHGASHGAELLSAEAMRARRVAVYTGAGISERAGLPSAPALCRYLLVTMPPALLLSLLLAPSLVANRFGRFVRKLQTTGSTPCHEALSRLQRLKGWTLATENTDCLHAATRSLAKPRSLLALLFVPQRFDLLVTVGLSGDHSGVVTSFQARSQAGVVVAVDPHTPPPFLRRKDVWLAADAHELLPLVAERLGCVQ